MEPLEKKLKQIQELLKAMGALPSPKMPEAPKPPSLTPPSQKNPLKVAQQIADPNVQKLAVKQAKAVLKVDKNGQWSLNKTSSNNPAENYLRSNYSPAGQAYLKEILYDVPAHFERAKLYGNDFTIKPVSSTQTKSITPIIKPEAMKNPTFSIDDFSGHDGWQDEIEHKYQVFHKNKSIGHVSVDSSGTGEWHQDFIDWVDKNPELNKPIKVGDYDSSPMTHVMGMAALHHVHNRIEKPKN